MPTEEFDKSILLSVIVPVYKVEEHIERCILSLQQQDIPKNAYEVIVINDGSPDNSRDVVLRLMDVFSNIIFIEQENRGVSMARNAGIDQAKGKYLLFVDPDDYVAPNSLDRVIKTADDQRAQVAFLGYIFLNADNTTKKEIFFAAEKGKIFTGIQIYTVSRGDGTTDPDRSWAILFNRDFINRHQLRNIADVPYLEDGEFIARVLCLAGRCIFEGGPFYIRTTRPGSATNSRLFYSDSAIKGFIRAAHHLFQFQQKNLLTKTQLQFLNQPICKFVLLAVNSSLHSDGIFKLNEVTAALKTHVLLKCPLKGTNKYYWRDGFVFNFSPKLYAVYKPAWSVIDNIYYRLFKVHP